MLALENFIAGKAKEKDWRLEGKPGLSDLPGEAVACDSLMFHQDQINEINGIFYSNLTIPNSYPDPMYNVTGPSSPSGEKAAVASKTDVQVQRVGRRGKN